MIEWLNGWMVAFFRNDLSCCSCFWWSCWCFCALEPAHNFFMEWLNHSCFFSHLLSVTMICGHVSFPTQTRNESRPCVCHYAYHQLVHSIGRCYDAPVLHIYMYTCIHVSYAWLYMSVFITFLFRAWMRQWCQKMILKPECINSKFLCHVIVTTPPTSSLIRLVAVSDAPVPTIYVFCFLFVLGVLMRQVAKQSCRLYISNHIEYQYFGHTSTLPFEIFNVLPYQKINLKCRIISENDVEI